MARIAKGVQRYVIEAAEPFIVSGAVPTIIQMGYGERAGQQPRVPGVEKPLGTVTAGGGKHALVCAFLAQHNAGPRAPFGRAASEPMSTVTATGSQQAVVSAGLLHLKGSKRGMSPGDAPAHTVLAGGGHQAEVRAFLVKYYGSGGQWQGCAEPMHTIPTRDRMGLVMVAGEPYQIADIGMRMLTPKELFAAQGFPADYIINPIAGGKRLTKSAQVRMCGNSVSPPVAAALVHANYTAAMQPAAEPRVPPDDLFAVAA
jgi:DNA (cytosine-5)-methyltransferase 1